MYDIPMCSLVATLTSTVSPETAKALIAAGYIVRVEDPSDRIYNADEFRAVGAEIVPAGSWINAPVNDVILGLKEIDADGSAFTHITLTKG